MDEPTKDPSPSGMPREDADAARPQEQEELGPIEGLVRGTATEAAARLTDDPAVAAEAGLQAAEEGLGAQEEGVETAQLFGLMLATVLAILSIVFVLYFLFFVTRRDHARQVAADVPAERYVELRTLRADAEELTGHYAVHPDAADRYRIPIEQAMVIVAQGGEEGSDVGAGAPQSRTDFNLYGASLRGAPAVQDVGAADGTALAAPGTADTTAGPRPATDAQVGAQPPDSL